MLRGMYQEISLLTDSLEDGDFRTLEDEMELEFDSGTLRVLHTPGHTPGSCSFVREANRTLICGDCVLKRITPNPIVSPDPIDPVKAFSLPWVNISSAWPVSANTSRRLHMAAMASRSPILKRFFTAMSAPSTNASDGSCRLSRQTERRHSRSPRNCFLHRLTTTCTGFWQYRKPSAHLDYAEKENKLVVEAGEGVEVYRRP